MKKVIIILIAVVSFNAASAQNPKDNHQQKDRKQVTQKRDNHNYNDPSRSNGFVYNNGQQGDRKGQADYDRINQRYDQRINGYRNDRSLNTKERDRRIHQAEMERQKSLAGFGTGAVAGGVVGFLLGVLVGH